MLSWYYTNALSRQTRARQTSQAALTSRVQGEMTLPPLGQIQPLRATPAPAPLSADVAEHGSDDGAAPQDESPLHPPPPPLAPPPPPASPLPLAQSSPGWAAMGGVPSSYSASQYGTSTPKTPAQLALERRLSGVAFARVSEPGVMPNGALSAGAAPEVGTSARSGDDLTPLLTPRATSSAQAQSLPTQRFLLAKGAFIDCTLETAIDSTLPGMTTCITATDTFGADGKVVLLERGTKLIGETRGQVQQGAARVFVLWTEARTPSGIVVPLDSPAADPLGRSGLAGEVDHHFWDRFGAAILISTLDGAVQSAVQSASHGGGAVIYNPSTSESIVTDVLKSTVNIAPTVTKRNGERIQVFVARDLDFRPVYALRTVPTR